MHVCMHDGNVLSRREYSQGGFEYNDCPIIPLILWCFFCLCCRKMRSAPRRCWNGAGRWRAVRTSMCTCCLTETWIKATGKVRDLSMQGWMEAGGICESAALNEGEKIASSQYLTCPCFTYVCIAFYITVLAEMVQQRFKPKGIPSEQWPTPQVLRLSHPVAPPFPEPAPPSPFGDGSDHAGEEVARGTSHHPEGSTSADASTSPVNSRLGGDDLGKGRHRHQSLRYQPLNPNPSNSNSAVFFLCQVGSVTSVGTQWLDLGIERCNDLLGRDSLSCILGACFFSFAWTCVRGCPTLSEVTPPTSPPSVTTSYYHLDN